jgi:hypothetical protein
MKIPLVSLVFWSSPILLHGEEIPPLPVMTAPETTQATIPAPISDGRPSPPPPVTDPEVKARHRLVF